MSEGPTKARGQEEGGDEEEEGIRGGERRRWENIQCMCECCTTISGGEQPLYFLASGVFTLFDSRLMIVCQIWYQPRIIVGGEW